MLPTSRAALHVCVECGKKRVLIAHWRIDTDERYVCNTLFLDAAFGVGGVSTRGNRAIAADLIVLHTNSKVTLPSDM